MDTWSCHICKKQRPDDKISVRTTDVSEGSGLPKGTMKINVRYCNDNEDCIEKSKTFDFFKKDK